MTGTHRNPGTTTTRFAPPCTTADAADAPGAGSAPAASDAAAFSEGTPNPAADTAALEADLREGFFNDPPTAPPRWFYDENGSLLFDEITRLPEYYQTRAEAEILRTRAADIVGTVGTMIELGAGTCEKTRALLDVLAGVSVPSRSTSDTRPPSRTSARADARFVPVDISTEMLHDTARALAAEYPDLHVDPVVGDITHLDGPLPGKPGDRLVLFLGGTIGNFSETQRAEFFAMLRRVMSPGDRLAVGFDLVKDPERLVAAYDDAAGVTAEFNLNMLDVIVRTVPCTGLDRADFRHEAVWNAGDSRIEMWLRATRDVHIDFPTLGRSRTLAAGAGIRTEIARKFQLDPLINELAGHGFSGGTVWTDQADDFGLVLVVVE